MIENVKNEELLTEDTVAETATNTVELTDAEAESEGGAELPQTNYVPEVSNAEFVAQSLSIAWNSFEALLVNKLGANEENEEWVRSACSLLRGSHLGTAIHAADLIDTYNYHVVTNRQHDEIIGFILQDKIAAVTSQYTAIPRAALSLHPKEMDADKRWLYTPLPAQRLLTGKERSIPVRIQTPKDTIFGYYELMIKEWATPDGKVARAGTTVPCVRIKSGYILPNSTWRWHEVEERDVKDAWLRGKDMVTVQRKVDNPIDNTNSEAVANDSEVSTPTDTN